MSVTVKSLNGDTAFLLTFCPAIVSQPLSPPFTILIDPWLTGPATIISSLFSISKQKLEPCIPTLKHLDREPDIILISQDKPDHCHEQTLKQLPTECRSPILAVPSAARKIRSWKHFKPELVQALPKFAPGNQESIYRLALPPAASQDACGGEVTITWIPAKRDVSGVHHAIGITYRSPSSPLSKSSVQYLDLPELPLSPPASPRSFRTITSTSTVVPAPHNDREKTLSVLYSPHGVPYDVVQPYASSHLVAEAALPLTALIHSFDRVENPWYLGGNISAGSPGGLEIARGLYSQAWISAHDAEKDNRGLSVMQTRIGKFAVEDIQMMLSDGQDAKRRVPIDLVTLQSGEEYKRERG